MLTRALALGLVGASEVAHQHDLANLAAGQQAPIGGLVLGRMQADATHAAVQLEPDGQRLAQLGLLDSLDLPLRMGDTPQVMLVDQRQFVGLEEAFEQQDRRPDAGLA